MTKPVLLVEDSTAGLYLWAMMNNFVWDNLFVIYIANPRCIGMDINISSFSDTKRLYELNGVIPSAGSDLMSTCLYEFKPGDKVLGVMDAASNEYRTRIKECRATARQMGVIFRDIQYNCASDILLSFRELSAWCKACRRFIRSEDVELDTILSDIQKSLENRKLGKKLFDNFDSIRSFALGHAKQCCFLDGELSAERTLDYFFQVYTENSRLSSTKKKLSDCFCYDCGFLEHFCVKHDLLGMKLRDIYENSILKSRMELATRKLGITMQSSSIESRPRSILTNTNNKAPKNQESIESYHLSNPECTDEIEEPKEVTDGEVVGETGESEEVIDDEIADVSKELTSLFD